MSLATSSKNRRVMVRAVYVGSGKSFACKAMEQRGHKVLFVCPTNKLVLNSRESGVALNQFFGVGMSEDGGVARISKINDTHTQTHTATSPYLTRSTSPACECLQR